MQRRSSARTPRKSYTEDAFAAIPELRAAADSGDTTPQQINDDEDDFVPDAEAPLPSEDELDDEPVNEDDGSDIEPKYENTPEPTSIPRNQTRRRPPPVDNRESFTRGIVDGLKFYLQAGKAMKRQMYFGASEVDQQTVYKGFNKWAHLPLLPSRATGFRGPYLTDEDGYSGRNDAAWQWICDDDLKMQWQIVTSSSLGDVKLPQQSRAFLLGPAQRPKHYMLPPQAAVPVGHAFDSAQRSGYILNAGGRVQCADWLPFVDGTLQYLAVATAVMEPSYRAASAPAVTAMPPTQTLLQVWSIDTTGGQHPALKTVISTSFGEYKHFQFCRFPARTTGPTPRLLAAIYRDGSLRIIVFPELTDSTEVVTIQQTLVTSTPPDTLYTCMSWMSPKRIIAGCANGCVALLDFSDAQNAENLRPRKFSTISPSYIIDIASCAPSCPTHFMSCSMDGTIRLTDAAQPSMAAPCATAHTARVRSLLTCCAWHDYTRGGILTDDTFAVRLHLVRRLFNLFTVGRTISSPTALATSLCHPFTMIGTAAGDVQCTNPMPKVIDSKAPVWQQTWFSHEWRRGRESDDPHTSVNGMSRFSEGFVPERAGLSKTQTPGEGMPGSVLTNTVYERESAVTTLSWNSNLHAAGWATAGLADGLLRVEDISIP